MNPCIATVTAFFTLPGGASPPGIVPSIMLLQNEQFIYGRKD